VVVNFTVKFTITPIYKCDFRKFELTESDGLLGMMMMRKERIPSWSLRKIKFSFELAGEVLDEDGRDNMGTALCEILNKC
jgi:hypothetical protein